MGLHSLEDIMLKDAAYRALEIVGEILFMAVIALYFFSYPLGMYLIFRNVIQNDIGNPFAWLLATGLAITVFLSIRFVQIVVLHYTGANPVSSFREELFGTLGRRGLWR